MSTRTPFHDGRTAAGESDVALPSVLDGVERTARAGAFWSAIGLPFVHVPLLLTGFDSVGGLAVFVALLLANVVALVVGHDHRETATEHE